MVAAPTHAHITHRRHSFFGDPIMFSRIKAERTKLKSADAIEAILKNVYSICFRIKDTYNKRLEAVESWNDRLEVFRMLVAEMTSVLSTGRCAQGRAGG